MTIKDKILTVSNAPAGSTMYDHIMSMKRTLMIPANMMEANISTDNIDISLQSSDLYGNISIDDINSNIDEQYIRGRINQSSKGVDYGI